MDTQKKEQQQHGRRYHYHLSKEEFRKRFINTGILAFSIFLYSLLIGILGYHYIVNLPWVDSFLNASMILGGMGVVAELRTDGQKIFAACYALFSGVAFLSSMAFFLSPLIHRFMLRFHINLGNGPYDDNVE